MAGGVCIWVLPEGNLHPCRCLPCLVDEWPSTAPVAAAQMRNLTAYSEVSPVYTMSEQVPQEA